MLFIREVFHLTQAEYGASALPSSVPIERKMTLTIREAAEYSNIGIGKIDALLKLPGCPFVLYVGTRKLVKRQAFEEYIQNKRMI